MPRVSKITDEEFLRLRNEGKSISEIARILRLTPGGVSQRLSRINNKMEQKGNDQRTCESCYNSKFKKGKSHCRTMEKKPSELFCYMKEQQAKKAEEAIRKYAVNHK